jgi:hypothetical protein
VEKGGNTTIIAGVVGVVSVLHNLSVFGVIVIVDVYCNLPTTPTIINGKTTPAGPVEAPRKAA